MAFSGDRLPAAPLAGSSPDDCHHVGEDDRSSGDDAEPSQHPAQTNWSDALPQRMLEVCPSGDQTSPAERQDEQEQRNQEDSDRRSKEVAAGGRHSRCSEDSPDPDGGY